MKNLTQAGLTTLSPCVRTEIRYTHPVTSRNVKPKHSRVLKEAYERDRFESQRG
jgi:hypothetical protein